MKKSISENPELVRLLDEHLNTLREELLRSYRYRIHLGAISPSFIGKGMIIQGTIYIERVDDDFSAIPFFS